LTLIPFGPPLHIVIANPSMNSDFLTPRGWFSPPVHASEDLTRRAFALWNTGWGTFGIGTAFLVVMIVLEPASTARRVGTIVGLAIIAAVAHEASRRGHTIAASWTFLALIIAFLTQRAWITGGIHAPILPLYVIAIMMGGVLLGGRGAWAATGAAVAGSGLLAAAELLGWIAPWQAFGSPVAMFLFSAMILGLAVLVQRMITRAFRASLRRERVRADVTRMIVHDMRGQLLVVLANLEVARLKVDGARVADLDAAIGASRAITKMADALLVPTDPPVRRGSP
jgi:signal transduction histidine kinase